MFANCKGEIQHAAHFCNVCALIALTGQKKWKFLPPKSMGVGSLPYLLISFGFL